MLRKLRRYWRARLAAAPPVEFDPVFYASSHADLQHLSTPAQLWAHFENHGRGEGRPPNLQEAMRLWQERYGPLPGDFSVAAYRLLNEDLGTSLVHDHQFIRHFLQHGRQEGRAFSIEEAFPSSGGADQLLRGTWPALFRTAEFVAMSQDWLPRSSLSRQEALQVFAEQGVARLSPISFRHGFDPGFYRQTYRLPPLGDDVTLYRDWLEQGVLAGRAPNEQVFLQPYIGLRSYPAGFDWQAYRHSLPSKAQATLINRAEVLAYLFDSDGNAAANPFLARDFDLLQALGHVYLHRGFLQKAARAYDLAKQAAAPGTGGMLHYQSGRSRRAHSDSDALTDFRLAVAHEEAPWEAVQALVEILLERKAFGEAFSILAREKAALRSQRPEFRLCARRALDACFDNARTQALELYGQGKRAEADDLVSGTVAAIRDAIEALEAFPPPLRPCEDGAVLILANQDLPQCTHYRVEQKLRQFKRAGLPAQAFPLDQVEAFVTALAGARAAIFYRAEATPAVLHAMLYARALGLPTYFDIDDLLFDSRYFPDGFESYEGQISRPDFHWLELGVPLQRFAMAMCDTAIASTPALALHMASVVRSGRAILLRNGLDERNDQVRLATRRTASPGETITLFYGTGTKAHSADFSRDLAPALLALLGKYPHLRLVIAGHLRLGQVFAPYSSQITHAGFIGNIAEYWSLLQACDINLAVLSPGAMTDCKSEIKWLEAAVLGIPSVVSSTATYREVLTHGVDALLVERAGEWLPLLERLIDDPVLRGTIGRNACEKALGTYGLDKGAQVLAAEFGAPAADPAALTTVSPLKVLICNLFFAPQSFGGATRIVQDNVDYLIDHCQDIEVSIFAGDDGPLAPGALRCDAYRGRPVFRTSCGQEELRDWLPSNAAHEAAFRKVLDLVRPDIVHFHCIQRLTGSIVEVTASAGIPYLVTLHDGWWISDSQFFTDEDGRLWLPDADHLKTCPVKGVSLAQSIARRLQLGRLLAEATHVLSVSNSFADVYRQAGIPNVGVLENGVPTLQPAARRPRSDGRLALGHLGGRSLHKGAFLVEAALRRGACEHLALTMIDNTLAPEERVETVWGQTPVLLRGPCAQHRVSELYAELDVLLAPSIWPESFGLVTREALCLGLKVIASSRGAIGESVDASNGLIVDVSSVTPLEHVLRDMNDAPDGWRTEARIPVRNMRRSEDQARELAELYRSIGRRQAS